MAFLGALDYSQGIKHPRNLMVPCLGVRVKVIGWKGVTPRIRLLGSIRFSHGVWLGAESGLQTCNELTCYVHLVSRFYFDRIYNFRVSLVQGLTQNTSELQ